MLKKFEIIASMIAKIEDGEERKKVAKFNVKRFSHPLVGSNFDPERFLELCNVTKEG